MVSDPRVSELLLTREHAIDEARRADTKASILLTVAGAAAAGVWVVSTSAPRLPWMVLAVAGVALVLLAVAVVFLLCALRPRLPQRAPVPGSWVHAASVDAVTLLSSLDDTTDRSQPRVRRTAEDTCRWSALARTKLARIGAGVRLIEAALVVLVGPVVGVVFQR